MNELKSISKYKNCYYSSTLNIVLNINNLPPAIAEVTIKVQGWLLDPAALEAWHMIVSLMTPFLTLYRKKLLVPLDLYWDGSTWLCCPVVEELIYQLNCISDAGPEDLIKHSSWTNSSLFTSIIVLLLAL